MLLEDDRVVETCRNVLNVLMYILDFLNNIYTYMHMLACVIKYNVLVRRGACMRVEMKHFQCRP